MKGLHFLVTLQCTRACPHCFVWGGPQQRPTVTAEDLRAWIGEAAAAGLSSCAFEGGEPFLYYPILLDGVKEATRRGLTAGAVTNGYWAVSPETARLALEPLAEAGLGSLMISTDDYHGGPEASCRARVALAAGTSVGLSAYLSQTKLEDVMFRGRAAERLASAALSGDVSQRPEQLTKCPHESLGDPGRVHVDPDGNLHVCQGLVMGNLRRQHLTDILGAFRPAAHPVIGPLLAGGPYGLAAAHGLTLRSAYADACHLCYETRRRLRDRYPECLTPGYLYGEGLGSKGWAAPQADPRQER